MKRAEQLAWGGFGGLLVITAMMITGGAMYHFTAFWAAAMLAGGQAVVVGLAAWGMSLGRQVEELSGYVPPSGAGAGLVTDERPISGFRMSAGDDGARTTTEPAGEARTLETGFQRLLVFSTGIVMLVLAAVTSWLVYGAYGWLRANPGMKLAIVGKYDSPKPEWMDEQSLLMGLAAAILYGVFYLMMRPPRTGRGRAGSYSEATRSTFTLGITGMAALALATVLGYMRVSGASEVAAGVIAFFMLLQGLELIVNSLRSYASIEEADQEQVDLQAMPLTPMLESVWLAGLRMLFAQSVGIAGKGAERGVIARLMPRSLLAILVIAIGCSCIRVVDPGEVAVLERLGYAPTDGKGHLLETGILQPGMHITFPWPIDELVRIPTQQLQVTQVGTELHASPAWKGIDFQFWTVRNSNEDKDTNDLFVTGDKGAGQLLETFVEVRWHVTDPATFYNAMSHSEYFDRSSTETKTLPIYEAIIQECTSFAVTRTFAIHSLEQIMVGDRREVEQHCREILQEKIDSMGKAIGLAGCGIHIEYLTIKDLHPPYWHADRYAPGEPRVGGRINFVANQEGKKQITIEADGTNSNIERGPASAFEFVVSMREFHETLIDLARAESTAEILDAQGFANSTKKRAEAYALDKVARAHGDADRLVEMTKGMEGMKPEERNYELGLLEQQ
ncbi:MAG TPA: SPFH domain-containing protein, partial [Phycisphaerae bacterium]